MRQTIIAIVVVAAWGLSATSALAQFRDPERRIITNLHLPSEKKDTTSVFTAGITFLIIPGDHNFSPAYGATLHGEFTRYSPLVIHGAASYSASGESTVAGILYDNSYRLAMQLDLTLRNARAKVSPYLGLGVSYISIGSITDRPYYREIGPYDESSGMSVWNLGNDFTWLARCGVMVRLAKALMAEIGMQYFPALPSIAFEYFSVTGTDRVSLGKFTESYDVPDLSLSMGVFAMLF